MSGAAAPPKCPVCGRPRDPRHRPFCSRRCADVDLNRWLSGRYVIPAGEDDEDDDPPLPGGGPASN